MITCLSVLSPEMACPYLFRAGGPSSPFEQMPDGLCRTAWRSARRAPASCRRTLLSLFGGRATANGRPIPAFPARSAGHNQRMRLVPWIPPLFRDRAAAGRVVSEAVAALQLDQPVVVGVARGGVAVALEVARELEAPLTAVDVERVNACGLRLGAVTAHGPPYLRGGMARRRRTSSRRSREPVVPPRCSRHGSGTRRCRLPGGRRSLSTSD